MKIYPLLTILLAIQLVWANDFTSPLSHDIAQVQSTTVTAKQYPKAKEQANELSEATLNGNYAKAADLTYPKLIEVIGGRKKYIAILQSQLKGMPANFRVLSNVAADPQDVIEVEKVIYAIVPTKMKIKVPEGVLVGDSYLIGVSSDGGEHWTFVDSGNGPTAHQLKILFPAAADKLRLPEHRPPVLQREP